MVAMVLEDGNAILEDRSQVRVAVVNDHQLLREGIVALLKSDPRISIVGKGRSRQEAIDLSDVQRPDVVLLDVQSSSLSSIQTIRELKASWPDIRVVILASCASDGYVIDTLVAGADGYLLKDASPEALIAGVVAVAAGQNVIEPTIARHVANLLSKRRADRGHSYDGLTRRELQMLSLIARGHMVKEISRELQISAKTVRNHVSNIYRKLGIFERSQAVLYAIRNGLASTD